jgi:glutathione S-transferase
MTVRIHGIVKSRALRPLWAAEELGMAYEQVVQPYQDGATRTPDFLALNPNGHIPVLVDQRPEGEVVGWESMACALYLARQHGRGDGSDIAPADAMEDAEALRWSFWTVNELEKDALTVLMHRLAMPAAQRRPELADVAERRLAVPLRVLEDALQRRQAQGHAHLAGPRFTVADLCVASVAHWLRPADGLLARHPHAKDWLHRCMARPAYRRLRQRD